MKFYYINKFHEILHVYFKEWKPFFWQYSLICWYIYCAHEYLWYILKSVCIISGHFNNDFCDSQKQYKYQITVWELYLHRDRSMRDTNKYYHNVRTTLHIFQIWNKIYSRKVELFMHQYENQYKTMLVSLILYSGSRSATHKTTMMTFWSGKTNITNNSIIIQW